VRSGDTVLVIGLGGLGLNGVQIARALGAHVIASDMRESSLEMARGFGAHEVLHARELVQRLERSKVDIVGDFVGHETTFQQAQSLVKPGGIISVIGLASPRVPLMPMLMATYEIRVLGSFWGTSIELQEVLNAIASGTIRPQVDPGQLEDVNHWMEELKSGRVRSRMALIPKAA
jgi:propanol-preferring alcohol dehydrogenase